MLGLLEASLVSAAVMKDFASSLIVLGKAGAALRMRCSTLARSLLES